MSDLATLESHRLALQAQLDAAKTQAERNQLGQFATPALLAQAILQETKHYFDPNTKIRFLDPAFGTGAFYSALLATYDNAMIERAESYEIDPHYGDAARELWHSHPLDLHLFDFTRTEPPPSQEKANLLICNPPYVRHHHLSAENKQYLRQKTMQRLSGLAGLYAYFLLLAHDWLAENGISCWLIPNEWMDVNYGQQIKQYLTTKVTLLRVHRFATETSQFDDALVSSTVLWFRKAQPTLNCFVCLSSGQSLTQPTWKKEIAHKQLDSRTKWSHYFRPTYSPKQKESAVYLSDLFQIKRGIATGANKFFMLTSEQVKINRLPTQFLKPVLPSPRYLETDEVLAEEDGLPQIAKRLFLLDCSLPEQKIYANHPTLWQYLELGRQQKIDQRYLCRHRHRWYEQEQRPPAPILCTYMGRNAQPFRFIRNHSLATAPNVYLMLYPTAQLQRQFHQDEMLLQRIWEWLTQVEGATLKQMGRSYGGGLFKLEPKELAQLQLDERIFSQLNIALRPVQAVLPFDF